MRMALGRMGLIRGGALAAVLGLAAAACVAQSPEGGRAATPTGGAGSAEAVSQAALPKLALRVGKVVVMDERDTVVNNAVVLVSGGKFESVKKASEATIPEGYERIDLPECWLVPGLVDCHNHTAGGLSDLNDMVYLTNPGLDTRATILPNNDLMPDARRGGVTTCMLLPGSGTNIAGFGTIAKTGGDTPDEVIVRSPGSLKVAQAGNPEWYFGGVGRSFMNWNTRQTLTKALKYHQKWAAYEANEPGATQPDYDPIFHNFRPLFRREMPATVHTQIYQVVLTTVEMLGGEFKLWVVLDHSEFDAWKLAPLVLHRDLWVINGPRTYHYDRTMRRFVGLCSAWWKNGIRKMGVNTDAPVVPQGQVSFQAANGCWYGWLPYPALQGLTKLPAQALGIYNRTGSIEPGKDADFGVWTGNPVDPRSACLITAVNGKIVYDARTEDTQRF
jgi:imidazolonepropionase-like amidohydrolase